MWLHGHQECVLAVTQFRIVPPGTMWAAEGAELQWTDVWKIVDLDGEVKAYLGTYVDDLIMVGPTEEVRSVLHKVEAIWECSGSQVLEKEGQELKFCGFQVLRTSDGYKLHQGLHPGPLRQEGSDGPIGVEGGGPSGSGG